MDKGGPKLKEGHPQTKFMGSHAGETFYGANGHGALKGVMTMSTLASNLSSLAYGPVQDLTGLTGKYDIDLTWAPDDATAAEATAPEAGTSASGASLHRPS